MRKVDWFTQRRGGAEIVSRVSALDLLIQSDAIAADAAKVAMETNISAPPRLRVNPCLSFFATQPFRENAHV